MSLKIDVIPHKPYSEMETEEKTTGDCKNIFSSIFLVFRNSEHILSPAPYRIMLAV